MNSKQYYVYILSNATNKVLYIGMTSDLAKRIYEHKNKVVDGFYEKYNVVKLVYFEVTSEAYSAVTKERQLKNWRREWKDNLIDKFNPEWKDLSLEF